MTKEFNLSERREKLFNEFIDAHPEYDYSSCRLFFSMLSDLDKEFIKRLKEEMSDEFERVEKVVPSEAAATTYVFMKRVRNKINKLAGEELI